MSVVACARAAFTVVDRVRRWMTYAFQPILNVWPFVHGLVMGSGSGVHLIHETACWRL